METDRLLDRHARPSETFVLVQHVMESVSVEGGGARSCLLGLALVLLELTWRLWKV